MIDLARNKILDILIEYDKQGTYPNLALKKHLRGIESARVKNFISAVVYGVIEKRILLDYYISIVSSIKIKKINSVVLNILRMGLYQIIFMSVPVSAACNTSVDLAKKNGQYKSSGFVNAILRKLAASHSEIKLPDRSEADYLSVKYSVCDSVLQKLKSSLGEENTECLLAYEFDVHDSIYVIPNFKKTNPDDLIFELSKLDICAQKTEYDYLVRIVDSIDIESCLLFKKGYFHVIGLPSYLAARALKPNAGDTVLDLCAAPGGKTFTIYNLCHGKCSLLAMDLHKHKAENLKRECSRLEFSDIDIRCFDSTVFDESLVNKADKVLCDVPCSGLGMIFSKPDIKYKQLDYDSLVKTQFKILNNAAKYVKIGGRVVYSTCTVNVEENNYVINSFLKNHSDFEIDKSVNICKDAFGEKTFLPNVDNCDGFYIAVLIRKN